MKNETMVKGDFEPIWKRWEREDEEERIAEKREKEVYRMDDELKEKLENVLLIVGGLDSWADHIRFNLTRLRDDIKDVDASLRDVLENEMLKDRGGKGK